jgi:S-(hydroxymethyl)glutathione dehydrogenase / alcohol dehydrogenase
MRNGNGGSGRTAASAKTGSFAATRRTALPTKTLAAILVEQHQPLTVAEIELPEHLDPGQVLVRVIYSGICGSQIGEIDGAKGDDRFLPHLLGHEGVASVLAIGPGVRHVKEGDTVVMHWRKGAGIEASPPAYRWNGRAVNAGWVTTFNHHAVVSENRLTPIPADSDLEVAALYGCAVTTGFGVVLNNARVQIGESVAVYGAGGIGLNIVQAAAMVSAYPIIAIDLYDAKLRLALEMGATHVVNAGRENAARAIASIAGADGLDCFIDNTGLPAIIQAGYTMTKPQGRVVLVGVPRKGQDISIHSLPLHFGKGLSGSHGGEAMPQTDIPRYQNLYRHGRLKLRGQITDRFPLEQINTAIERMRNGAIVGRCLVDMRSRV